MAGQFGQVVGAQVTALQDAPIATGPGRCHRLRRGCAGNTSVPYYGNAGGLATERRAALTALTYRRLKSGSVASMTDPFRPVCGSEAGTRPAASSVSKVVLAMPQHKLGIELGYGLAFSEPNEESMSRIVASPKSNPPRV
jgi:hypothetical protein